MPTSVFIAESLSPLDYYERRMDGFAANEVLKIQSCKTDYRLVLTRNLLERAIQEADSGDYEIFHLSCHGNSDGIQLADGDQINWLDLGLMFKKYAKKNRILVMASCSGGHNDLTKALKKSRSLFGYVVGSASKEGVGFTDSCIAWSIFYREIIQKGLDQSVLQHAIKIINRSCEGEFVYRRWDASKCVYLRYSGDKTPAQP